MLKHYHCLPKTAFEDGSGYLLRVIQPQDIEQIRVWRNQQTSVLRQQKEITSEEQIRYFDTHIWPTFAESTPKQILLGFLCDGVLIGYGGLVFIDWEAKRAEVSFLLDPARTQNQANYDKEFTQFLRLLANVAFNHLHFHRLFTETFAFRGDHMAVLERFGFKREGILRDHVFKMGTWVDSYLHGLLEKDYRNGI